MPVVETAPALITYYEDDDFTDPWTKPEIVMLVHGADESSRAWYAWVPHLARRFRVLRPDLRGFGRSTVPSDPLDYPWSMAGFAADLASFLDALGIEAVHVIGAKLGGSVALQFACDYPERTRTLTVVSGPARAHNTGGTVDLGSVTEMIESLGVKGWAAATQRTRLGSAVPEEQIAWWTELMALTDPGVALGISIAAARLDLSGLLSRIKAPALILTSEGSGLQSVEATRGWQQMIPNSELEVLPGDGFHIAAAIPDVCAQRVLAFLERHSQPGQS